MLEPPVVKGKERHDQQVEISFLRDPMLLQRIVLDGLDDRIVGEDNARKTIFLCAMGSLVLNANRTSYNLLVNSESGAGKDYLVDNVLKILPKSKVHKRTRISPTALTYWHNSKFEPNWSWDGKVLYLEDCSNAILNCDVFKVFTSGGSHATIVKDQRAIDIEIKGKPVVIITSASATPEPEMVRRFFVINLTETEEQTKEIVAKWGDYGASGKVLKEQNSYHDLLEKLQPRKVKVPFAKKLAKVFPTSHIISRTNFSRFMDLIKASAVLHQYAREDDTDGFIYANKQDYEISRSVLTTSSSNDKLVPLTKSDRQIIEVLKDMGKNIIEQYSSITNKEIEKEIGWTLKELEGRISFLSRAQLWRRLNKLCEYGFIEKETIKLDYSKKPVVVYSFKEMEKVNLPLWEDLK